MKTGPGAILAITLVVCLILGCASAVKSVKQDAKEGTEAPVNTGGEAALGSSAKPPVPPAPSLEKPTSEPPTPPAPSAPSPNSKPAYEPPPPPPKEPALAPGEEDARGAAILLIRNIPNLVHAKICYSKSDGEWVLYVFKGKDPKIRMQQYILNPGTNEFVLTGPQDPITVANMDVYLKTEVADQTCSILK